MNKYNVYTDTEKEMFTNTFINKRENSKQQFEEYVKKFFESLPLQNKPVINRVKFSKQKFYVRGFTGPTTITVPSGTQFNTHNTLWDLKTKDNLVTHFLAHPDFQITNTSLHKLNFLHPNWNHQNKEGKNALMLLAQRHELHDLMKVLTDFKLDTEKQDKDHKFFTHYMFSPPKTQKELYFFMIHTSDHLNRIETLIDTYPHHFQISPVRLQRVVSEWSNTMEVLNDNLKRITNINNIRGHNSGLDDIESQGGRILSKMFSKKLETIFDEKEESPRKLKI